MTPPATLSATDPKILIVDDHALFREGLRWIFERLGAATSVVEAGSVEEGLAQAAAAGDIDLVCLDLYLPGCRGLDALQRFRRGFPGLPIVLLSGTDDAALVREGLASGARGFIHKSVTADALLDGVRQVLRGHGCHVLAADSDAAASHEVGQLTERQREILACVCEGLTYKEIARRLGISNATVRNHVCRIFHTLGVHSRTEAALLAYRHGVA